MKALRFISALAFCTLFGTAHAQVSFTADPTAPIAGQYPWGPSPWSRNHKSSWSIQSVLGRVTAIQADTYLIRTDLWDIYHIHIGPQVQITKETTEALNASGAIGSWTSQTIKPSEIKVGDCIFVDGNTDKEKRSIKALHIVRLSLKHVMQIRLARLSYGKTWLEGQLISLHNEDAKVQGPLELPTLRFAIDKNTAFTKDVVPIAKTDLHNGEFVRVDGSIIHGKFVASTINVLFE